MTATQHVDAGRPARNPTPTLLVLSVGYFAMGTASLSVVGLSVPMGHDLRVPAASIGLLVTVFAVTFAFAAPLAPVVLGRLDRKWTMALGLAVLTAGAAATALVADYGLVVAARVVTALGAAVFTPLASAAGAGIVAPERRQRALATVFAGMTVAAVLGVPLVTLLSDTIGWRAALLAVAALAGLALVGVLVLVPALSVGERPGLAAYRTVLRTAGAVPAVATTLLFMAGQFVVYAIAGAYLTERFAATPGTISITLLIFGVAGVLGNAVAGRVGDRVGGTRLVSSALAGLAVAYVGLVVTPPALGAGMVAFAVWAFAAQLYQAPQQGRLVGLLPGQPALVLALNAAALYLGMSVGSLLGSTFLPEVGATALPGIGLVLVAMAAVTHAASTRSIARSEPEQERVGEGATSMPTDTGHADLVRGYIDQLWNEGRTDLAEQYLAEDLIQHNPGLPDGRAPLVAFIEQFKRQLPDGRFRVRRVIADGDLAVAHSLFVTGADGGAQAVVDIFRIVEGRIVEHWDVKEPVPETSANGHELV